MSEGEVVVVFGGDASQLEAAAAEAKGHIRGLEAELARLSKEFSAKPTDDGLKAHILEVSKALMEAKEHFGEVKEKLHEHYSAAKEADKGWEELKDTLVEYGELAGITLGADGLKEWAVGQVEAAEQIENASHRMGASVVQVQQLMGFAKSSGLDFQSLEADLNKLQLTLAKVGREGSPAAAALKALGVSASELRKQNPEQQLETLADAFSRFADGPAKTQIAESLGKSFVELLPLLDKGGEGFEELNAALARTGYVSSAETVHGLAETKEALSELSLAANGLMTAIFEPLNGVMKGVVQAFSDLAIAFRRDAEEGGVIAAAMTTWHYTLGFLAEDVILLGAAFRSMWALVDSVFVAVEAEFGHLVVEAQAAAELIKNAFTHPGDLSGAWKSYTDSIGADSVATTKKIAAAWGELPAKFAQIGADIKKEHDSVWKGTLLGRDAESVGDPMGALKKAMSGGNKPDGAALGGANAGAFGGLSNPWAKPQAPLLNLDGGRGSRDAGKDAEAEAQAEVKLFTEAAEAKKGLLEEGLKTHAINMGEWLSQTRDMLQDEAQDITATYETELRAAGLTSAQIIKIKGDEAEQLKRIAKEVQEAEAKYAEDIQQKYEQVATTISGAFNSQLKGLLAGTESWGQAMKSVVADLTLKLIESSVTFTAKWLADEAARTVASETGAAARATADAGAASSGMLANAGLILKSIMADAAATFGGVFAFLAPAMGPAAAGPALGAQAAVLGAAAGVASADIGMWQVPGDQLAMVHHNELIMPAAQAGAFRSMLSGGGTGGGGVTVNYAPNVQALDGPSVARFLNQHAQAIAKSVGATQRANPSTR